MFKMVNGFKNVFRRDEGFTLIELLVVIAVLGILAALAIPRLTGVTNRARLAEADQVLGSLKTGMEMFFVENNNYSVTNTGDLVGTPNELSNFIDITSLPPVTEWTIAVTGGAAGFTITATGVGENAGLNASIDETGTITH